MRKILSVLALLPAFFILAAASWESPAGENAKPFVSFRMQELDEKVEVGYAVLCVDVNGDGKKDIVVVDTKRVIWFENPTWKVHTIIKGLTKPDNVCIDAYDIDGDGKIDFALGADWKPFNTKSGGTLQWLKRGKNIDEPWSLYPIDTEPTVHRIRFADIDGNGKKRDASSWCRSWGARLATAKKRELDRRLAAARHRVSHPQGSDQGPLDAGGAR